MFARLRCKTSKGLLVLARRLGLASFYAANQLHSVRPRHFFRGRRSLGQKCMLLHQRATLVEVDVSREYHATTDREHANGSTTGGMRRLFGLEGERAACNWASCG